MENSSYAEAERRLKQLQDLNAAGRNDSADADRVREELERLWGQLTAGEQQLLDGLSADLYMLTKEEPERPFSSSDREQLLVAIRRAYDSRDWMRMLGLLRLGSSVVPDAARAFLRARAWGELRHPLPAQWFLEHALRLEPHNVQFRLLHLDAMAKGDDRDAAIQRGNAVLSDPTSPSGLVYGAARILFERGRDLPLVQQRALDEKVVAALRSALARESAQPVPSRIPALTTAGRLTFAMALERIGSESEAGMAYDEMVSSNPGSETARMARALFLMERRPDEAWSDLRDLVARRTTLVFPYFYLAHAAITHGDHDTAVQLSLDALQRQPRPPLAASLYEWIAISMFEKGASREVVRELFQHAQALDPLNPRIQQNVATFEAALTQRVAHQVPPAFVLEQAPDRVEAAREVSAGAGILP